MILGTIATCCLIAVVFALALASVSPKWGDRLFIVAYAALFVTVAIMLAKGLIHG